MPRTRSIGEVLADPKSNLHRNVQRATVTMRHNSEVIAALVADGYTVEEAWAQCLGFGTKKEES
jgi:hypothetical protein